METLKTLPICFGIGPSVFFELSEEFSELSQPTVGVFSYTEDQFPLRNYSKVISSFQVENWQYKSLKNDETVFIVNSSDSVYYSRCSLKKRIDNRKYQDSALRAYRRNSLAEGESVHHMRLDCSQENAKDLAILKNSTHKKLHDIHDIENKLEVLEWFEKCNFKYKKIFLKGVGTAYKDTVYVLKDLKLSEGETIQSVFENLKSDLVSKMYDLNLEVCDDLKNSLEQNTAYMKNLRDIRNRMRCYEARSQTPIPTPSDSKLRRMYLSRSHGGCQKSMGKNDFANRVIRTKCQQGSQSGCRNYK